MIHLAQTLALAFIIVAGVVSIIGIVAYSLLKSDGKLGRAKENPAVQAARDNLAMARLHAEQDLIELRRDQIVDARHRGVELPEGIEDEIKRPEGLRAVVGEILPKKPQGSRSYGSRD